MDEGGTAIHTEGFGEADGIRGAGGADGFHLQRRLIRLGYLLINRREADLRGHGLTLNQSTALLHFAAHPGDSCRDLSRRLQTSHQAAQKTVAHLQQRGLLTTCVSPDDARVHPVSTTPEGARLAADLRGHGEDAGNEVFSRLDAAERLVLADMVERMILGLEDTAAATATGEAQR